MSMLANLEADIKPLALTIDLSQENTNDIFEVAGNSKLVIKVADNPTTGFRWTIDPSQCGSKIQNLQEDFEAPTNGLIGAGGTRVWTMETPEPAENYIRGLACTVDFGFGRPWEQDGSETPAKSIVLMIN